jgi:hypothetical protein
VSRIVFGHNVLNETIMHIVIMFKMCSTFAKHDLRIGIVNVITMELMDRLERYI